MSAEQTRAARLNSLSLAPARAQNIVRLLLLMAFLLIGILSAAGLTSRRWTPAFWSSAGPTSSGC